MLCRGESVAVVLGIKKYLRSFQDKVLPRYLIQASKLAYFDKFQRLR